MKRRLTFSILFLLIFIMPALNAPKLRIKVQGKWIFDVQQSDVTVAGSDLPVYVSILEEISIDCTKPSTNWYVDVRRADINWPAGASLYVRRTTDGTDSTGIGTITGGTSYQEVTTADTYFFSGTEERKDVKVQLRLEVNTLDLFVDTYDCEVYYTLWE